MDYPPVSASFRRSSHTRSSRFVYLALSGFNLGPPPLGEAWRLGPCSQGFRRSAARSFRLPGQVRPPMAEGGLIPLLLRASWRTRACDFHRTRLSRDYLSSVALRLPCHLLSISPSSSRMHESPVTSLLCRMITSYRPSPCTRLSRAQTTTAAPPLIQSIGGLLALASPYKLPTFTKLDSCELI